MTDIPEDIRSAAARAVGPTIDPRGELATRVAAAILAERERFAAEINRLQVEASNHAADAERVRRERDALIRGEA